MRLLDECVDSNWISEMSSGRQLCDREKPTFRLVHILPCVFPTQHIVDFFPLHMCPHGDLWLGGIVSCQSKSEILGDPGGEYKKG